MKTRALAVAVVGVLVHSASVTAADERPQLKDVSTIRIANYGIPSTVIKDREQVNALVRELRQLRTKAWRRADTKLFCYATLVVLSGERTLSLFRVSPEVVVERAPGKGQSSYSLALDQTDAAGIKALLTEIPPPKDCK